MFVNPDCCCKNFLSHIRVKIPLIHAYESQNYDDGELLLLQSNEQCWGGTCLFQNLTYIWVLSVRKRSFHSPFVSSDGSPGL